MANVITVVQPKGGVGKTTTTFNAAGVLAEHGLKVLMIDADPSAGLSFAAFPENAPTDEFENSTYEVLNRRSKIGIDECILETTTPNVDLVPARYELVDHDFNMELLFALRDEIAEMKSEYDFVVIDCAPSLGVLARSAMLASDLVLAPVQAEWLVLRGLLVLNRIIDDLREAWKDAASFQVRYLLTMVHSNPRAKHGKAIQKIVRDQYGDLVLDQFITRYDGFNNAAADGRPLVTADPTHKGSNQYRRAIRELVRFGNPAAEDEVKRQDEYEKSVREYEAAVNG